MTRIGAAFSLAVALAAALLSGCGGRGTRTITVPFYLVSFRSDSNAQVLTDTATLFTLFVTVTDTAGNPVGGQTVLLTAPASGPSCTFVTPSPEGPNFSRVQTNAQGLAAVGVRSNGTVGTYAVSAVAINQQNIGACLLTNAVAAIPTTLSVVDAAAAATAKFAPAGSGSQIFGPALVPAGTNVAPLFDADGSAGPVTATGQASYLFWVDDQPGSKFSHPTRIVILDATDAAAGFVDRAQVIDAEWWPQAQIPGQANPTDLLPPASVDNNFKNGDPSAVFNLAGNTRAPNDACAIIVRGPNVDGSLHDMLRFRDYLVLTGKVPIANATMQNAVVTRKELMDLIEAAMAKGCKKLYLYITSHGGRGFICLGKEGTRESSDNISYGEIAQKLKGFMTVCVALDACYTGTAISFFQNIGLMGTIVTAADRESYSKITTVDGIHASAWTQAFTKCGSDPAADADGNNEVSFEEAQAWAKKNGSEQVKQANPLTSAIGEVAPIAYNAPNLNILKPATAGVISLPRPTALAAQHTLSMVLTIANPGIAFIGGMQTITVTFGANEFAPKQISVIGLQNGQTTYQLSGFSSNGDLFSSNVATISVGASYAGNPSPVNTLCKTDQSVEILRTGALIGTMSTANVTASNSNISPSSSTLPFQAAETSKNLFVTTIWTAHPPLTSTLTIFDATNNLGVDIPIFIHQELTLDIQLVAKDGFVFAAGTKIRTDRIQNFHIGGPDACPLWHMHSATQDTITIDGHVIDDPRKPTCGYGHVIQP